MMRKDEAVIFCRVSTKPQFERMSPEDQEAFCVNYAKRKGLVVKQIVNVPESGYKSRTEFNKMLAFIKENGIGHLVTLNLERLTRDMQAFLNVNRLVLENGLKVHLCESNEVIDDRSAKDAKLVWKIKVSFFEYTIEDLKDKARRSMEGRLERGLYPFVNPPQGYDLKAGQLTPNASAALVKKAFALYAGGTESVASLRARLKPEGLKISEPALGQLLQNPAVVGELEWPWPESKYVAAKHFKGERIKGQHASIITHDVFDRVQAVLKNKSRSHPFKADQKFFLYRGLLRCACGKVMSGANISGQIRYMPNHRAGQSCGVTGVRAENIDHAVALALKQLALPPTDQKWARKALESYANKSSKEFKLERVRAQNEYDKAIADLDAAISEAFQRQMARVFDPRTIAGKVKEIESRRDKAKEILDRLDSVNSKGKTNFVEDGLALLKLVNDLDSSYWDKPQRRALLLRQLFKSIDLTADKRINIVAEDVFAPLFTLRNHKGRATKQSLLLL